MNPIEAAARAVLKPKDNRPPWQWIQDNVRIANSPYGSVPNFELTPWLKEPSECFADTRRRHHTLMCCVQGSKTFFVLSHAIWALCQAPGPLGIYVQTNEHVKKTAHGRWLPMVESTPPLRQLLRQGDRFAKGIAEIYFQHTFAFIMAANESNAQSISLRYDMNDECAIWTPGILLECHKRTSRWWNRVIVDASTAADVGTDFDDSWQASDRRFWRLRCPECRTLQIPDLDKHLKWPTNEITKPKGKWNFDAVKAATRFVCEKCGAALPHTESVASLMNRHGDYLPTNPGAPFEHIGYHWNSMVLRPSELSWGDLAVEMIQAAKAWKAGYHEPMRELTRKRKALPFDAKKINPFADLPVIEITSSSLPPKKFWTLQDRIFLGCDVQIDHFWVLVQAWSLAGDECSLLAKKVYNWADVRSIQEEYFIPDEDVCVDWSHRPAEVVTECSRNGHPIKVGMLWQWACWKALRGSDEFQFLYKSPKTGQRVPLPYAWPPAAGDPCLGLPADHPRRKEFVMAMQNPRQTLSRRCQIITWSNPSIKDIVIARRDGQVAVKVETLKGDWNAEYFRQINSQKKVQVYGRYGGARWKYENYTDDHLLDCRCMIAVRAIQRGLIADAAPTIILPVGEETKG